MCWVLRTWDGFASHLYEEKITLQRLHPMRPKLPGTPHANATHPEFPHNPGSYPMPSGSRCDLLCVRRGGCPIAAS